MGLRHRPGKGDGAGRRAKTIERLQPIDTTTLHERAYAHLKQAIMSGLFRPGEPVTLRGMAHALGVSIMPVREAVRRLISEHALEMPTSRSTRVPSMSQEHFSDLCRCRVLLEGEAAALAADNFDAPALQHLSEVQAEIEARAARNDVRGMLAANQAFHSAVYNRCGSALLLSMIEALWLQSGPYLSLLAQNRPGKQAIEVDHSQHLKLIDALARGNAAAAKAAVSADITGHCELSLRQKQSSPEEAWPAAT